MAYSVKLSDETITKAKIASQALGRSVAGQIEHWVKIGRLIEDNPDLTYEMIKDILIAYQEVRVGKVELYQFADNDSK
jgi:hypothetical protein